MWIFVTPVQRSMKLAESYPQYEVVPDGSAVETRRIESGGEEDADVQTAGVRLRVDDARGGDGRRPQDHVREGPVAEWSPIWVSSAAPSCGHGVWYRGCLGGCCATGEQARERVVRPEWGR